MMANRSRPNHESGCAGCVLRWILLIALGVALLAMRPEPSIALASCGDGTCDPGETAQSCPHDCGIPLLEEDFEDREAQGWAYDPARWEIVTDGGSLVWANTQQAWASIGSNAWSDYTLFVRMRRVNSDANLYVRVEGANSYALRAEGARVVLWTESAGVDQDLASSAVALGTTWHDYRIDAIGAQLAVTIDGTTVLTHTDGPSALLNGGIALEAFQADGAHFDDIRLYSVVPQCYNGVRDGDETGIDCGGACAIQDCCANRAWDANLGEGGVDCGGPCALACQPAERLDRWTQTNGPWLEYIRRIRFDPDDPDTLIISSNTGSGVAKSTDAGQSWHIISGPAGAGGISPMNVFGLAMDPTDKDTLYAGTANGRLYATQDGGATWDLLWHYTEVDDALWSVEVDPTDRDRLFVGMGDYTGCDGRVYRSEDRGLTWDKVLDVDPASDWDGGFISHIAFDPTDAGTMYATTGIGDWCGGTDPGDPDAFSFGIWKSVNGGASWFPINNGLQDLTVSHLVIDPLDPQTLYAGVGCVDDDINLPGNVFKSVDGGANWAPLDVSPGTPITRLSLHPGDPEHVYALGYGGVFESPDAGATWSRIDEVFKSAVYTFVYDHAFAPDDPETMYVGTYAGGIIKSLDGGRNWFEINGLRHDGEVLANSYGTAVDPADPDTLYATTIGGVFKSASGGETWDFIGEGVFQHLREIALDPAEPNRLYLGGDSTNFYTSDDGGETWNHVPMDQVALGGDPQFPVIAVDPHSPNRILTGLTGSSDILMRSVDYGQTWTGAAPLGIAGETHAIAYHPTLSGTVYAGVGWSPDQPRLIRSDDGGATWQDAAPGLSLLTVYQMAEQGDRLYAATNGSGVHVGWAGGSGVWEPIHRVGPGHELQYVTRLVEGGDPPSLLAFDKSDLTLYRQTVPADPEHPWDPVLRLVDPTDDLYDVAYDPDTAARAYATTRLGGVWRSDDGGATWGQANVGLPSEAVMRGLAVDETASSTIYVGESGAPGRVYRSVNGGSNWSLLSDDLTFSTVHAFARDPSDPDVAYAGLWGGGTWKTEDGGTTWMPLPEAPASAAALAVDPRDPQIVYATDRTEPTVWQSNDGGQRWWRRFNAGPDYSRLQALVIDPHRADTLYVSAFRRGGYGIEGALFRVSRGGTADVTHGLPRVAISLATSPDQPGLLLASTHVYGLYRSENYGRSWQAIGAVEGLPKVGFNALAWDPSDEALYGGACSGSFADYLRPPGLPDGDDEPGLYRSTDRGQTWQKVLPDVVGKSFAFAGGRAYAATTSGLYLSTDGGDSWTAQPGGPALDYATVTAGARALYVGTLGGSVHLAALNPDGSLAWQGSAGPTAEIHALQLLSVPERPGTLFATSFPGGVFKSTDGGASWHEANFGLPGFTLADPDRNGYYALVVNPANPDNLYLGIYGYGVYRSDDGAATWLPANAGLGNRYVYALHVSNDGSYVWASTNDGVQSLWRAATDMPGRLSWSPAPASPQHRQAVTDIVINPENPDEMTIAGFPSGVFATSDGGAHWHERSNNLRVAKRRTHGVGFEDGYYQLAVDPLDPRHLVYGTYTAEVYETHDGGQSWSAFDEGLVREGSIYALDISSDGARIYVSQKAGGILRRALDPTAAQTRVVAAGGMPCTDGSHVYGTVTQALVAANPGDRLIVCPGSYVEDVTVNQRVRLESYAGPAHTYLQSATVTADGARIAGFRLDALAVEDATDVALLGNVVIASELYLPVLLRR